ncbi:TPA: fimbrial protein [Morganella morganii]|nr:type 1 fimbrial protein [Morganella morganii]
MSLFKRKLIISSLLLLSFNAFSADDDINEITPEADVADAKEITGNIRFTGKITDSSCDITQKDKDVYLGEHSVAKLKKNDDRTEEKAFDISLINCSLAMTSLRIKMEGTAHADNATLYALDANDKSAGKVGISIMTAEGQQVTPAGGYRDIPLKADSRDYTLNYTAAYQATGLATPGEGNATVNYTVSYE